MRNLTNQLIEVVKWYPLGVALGIPAYKLDAIEQNQRGDVGRCKMGMLDVWLRSDLEASWEKLARALEDDYVAVAARIRKKYLGSSQGTLSDVLSILFKILYRIFLIKYYPAVI